MLKAYCLGWNGKAKDVAHVLFQVLEGDLDAARIGLEVDKSMDLFKTICAIVVKDENSNDGGAGASSARIDVRLGL